MTDTNNNFEEISKDKLEASLERRTIVNDDERKALDVLAKAITRGVPIPLDTREYREDFSQIIYDQMRYIKNL